MKVFYFILTDKLTWGRGLTIADAIGNALVDKKTQYQISIGICKKDTPDEVVKNLMTCFGVTDFGGINFYDNPSDEDTKQAKEYFLGWANDTSLIKPKTSKKK